MKKDYKDVVNSVITSFEHQFVGMSKRSIINLVFDQITENKLIADFSRTSLYNTIYYFLRKRNVFKVEEIKYRFDSISSKLKFLDSVKVDMNDRWWFYHDLFFGEVERPVLAGGTKVISGQLNYLIDSKRGPEFDLLYTTLYFRDLRKVVNSDLYQIFVKRQLNDMLYGIFDSLYELDSVVKEFAASLDKTQIKQFMALITHFYGFLSEFNVSEYSRFHSEMIRNVNAFKKFIRETGNVTILEYNKNRFFDAITFVNIVYSCALRQLNHDSHMDAYLNIHYLINSTTYFVFFKFAKKLQRNNCNKLVDFFNSDLYFSYSRYIIEYYNMFYNEVAKIIDEFKNDSKETLFQFDIVLRYMLYNKFRNLVNANMKRYLSIDFDVTDSCFMDVDDVNDCVLYECNLYCDTEPVDEITDRKFSSICEQFFTLNDALNRDDVTNVAIELCNGNNGVLWKYDEATREAGKMLVETLKETVI